MILWDYIKEQMLRYKDQKVCEEDTEISFNELISRSEHFADKLRGFRCCAILCKSEMLSAAALLSCFAAGVTAVPLSLRYGTAHCSKILDTISPDAMITDTDGELSVGKYEGSKYSEPEEHPALIMCTSGTTGKPKGAMLSERNIITNVGDIASYFEIGSGDKIFISRPLYHCAVLTGEFLVSLVKGVAIQFYSEKFNPIRMLELIDQYSITAFCGTPTLLSAMARFKRDSRTKTLRHICISGECMGADTALMIRNSFPQCKIYHVYGLTEACPRVSYLPPEQFAKHPDCVGIPLKSVSLKILDTSGKECGKNEEGILWVKGENVMLGYYAEKEKTQKVLKDGWLCTGDIACIGDSGFLKIKGRNDDLIIKAGMNIYPAEVEYELKRDSRVKEVLVYGFDTISGKQIGMKIVGDFLSVDEVRKLCIEHLPLFQIPQVIELVDELPKNGSGKIIRGRIKS